MQIEINVDIENNEGTACPWWMIIDPRQNLRKDSDACHDIAAMITGPFFSRGEARKHLMGRRYDFGPGAVVYCASGYWSDVYRSAIKRGKSAVRKGK